MIKKRKLPKLWVLTFLTIIFSCSQQENLKQNVISLDNKNYKVLDPYLKDKTVVGIGEYTHGDGKLFELKTEIIKYLHENLGFEAVLMESDFLSVEKTIPSLSNRSTKEAANIGIQSTWADSKEYLSLIDYLNETAKNGDTLYFHGIDSQITGKETLDIHKAQADLIGDKISIEEYDNLISSIKIIKSRNVSNVTLDSIKILKKNAANILLEEQNQISDKTHQWLKNIVGNLNALIYLKSAPSVTPENIPEIFSHPNFLKSGSIRDSLMTDNINYYLKKYNKVVVWAANKHLQIKSNDKTWMGELLKKDLGDKYYSILVLYNHGVWSYPQGNPNGIIPKPVEGTLAYEIANVTNSSVSFLDVKTNQIPRMKIRTNNWMTTDSIVIKNYCDAILYVHEATGSTMAFDEEN